MQKITSRQNDLVKNIKKLILQKKYRDKSGKVILDGVHLCEEFLRRFSDFSALVFSEKFLSHPEMRKFHNFLEDDSLAAFIYCVPDDLFAVISPTDNPMGVLMVVDKKYLVSMPENNFEEGKYLLLDGIQDPGNMGTLLRTAAAAGIKGIYCDGGADVFSPKVLRAGMGAHFCVPIFEGVDFAEFAKNFSESGGQIYGLALDKEARNFLDVRRDNEGNNMRMSAYMLGSEGLGISAKNLELCDERIYIPMQNGMESLNVGVCGGVVMFA